MSKSRKILEADIREIYLGNLGTVDTDMKLPDQGKRGSRFTWKSSQTLFVSNIGEVTRPTYGVGNREVVLTVTAEYEGQSQQQDYVVTVLEEVPENRIVRTIDIEETVSGQAYRLPGVCVVELDNHTYSTAEVKWTGNVDVSQKSQQLRGEVEGTDLPVFAKITYKQKSEKKKVINRLESKRIRLEDGSLYKDAAEHMVEHLKCVDTEQLLYSFRDAAGLSVGNTEPMTGWDAPACSLRGHTTGHYLSAFSFAFYVTGEKVFDEKVKKLVEGLKQCQDAMAERGMHKGFLSAYGEEQFDLLEQYTTYPAIWAPYYTLDKILNGLLDSYEYGACKTGLEVAVKIGEWVSWRLGRLSGEQLNKMWSIYIAGEFGCMITALVRLYHLTQKQKYLKTALLFENDKLFVPMRFNYDTLNGVHANQHIPQIIGALDIYEETGCPKYLEIAENFWNITVYHHTYAIGGIGETEMFKQADHISDYLSMKTAESCASYNMLKLTKKLFDLNPRAGYFDYYENTLHNHLLAAASHESDGGTTYFMPLAPGAQKKFDTSENTCCHGTGLETLFRFQKDIYSFGENECYVNLFYPSIVEWQEKGTVIRQIDTEYGIELLVEAEQAFTMKVRRPGWAALKHISVNGNVTESNQEEYLDFALPCGKSSVKITFEAFTRIHPANDNEHIVSISYGRDILVCCTEAKDFITVTDDMLKAGVRKTEGNYFLGNLELKPINMVNEECYQVYFKRV